MTRRDARPGQVRTVLVAHPGAEMYGSDRMLLESVRGMASRGWRVVVTLPAEGPLIAELRGTGAEVVLCPAPVLRKSALRARGLVALTGALVAGTRQGGRLLDRVRPDAVYVSTLTLPWWLVLARWHRARVVCHVHEAEGAAPLIVRRALALPMLMADRIAVNSRFSLSVLCGAEPALAARATVVANGVAGPPAITPPRDRIDGAVRLLYVGRLSARKGVDVAVDAVARLRDLGTDAHLDVVGAVYPGNEAYDRDLRARSRRLGVNDRVVFHGFRDDPWPFLAACDVAVVPSRVDEPFGNTAVEAVLAARPVVVSDTSGLREAASGYRSAAVVPPDDPAAVADAVVTLVENWDVSRRAALDDAGVATARHSVRRYREVVADLVIPARVDEPTEAPA